MEENKFDSELDSLFDFEPKRVNPQQAEKVIDTFNKIRPKVAETWREVRRQVKESGVDSEVFGDIAISHAGEGGTEEDVIRTLAHHASITNEEED